MHNFPKAYNIVKPIIDKHDPEGLLKMGAPPDEYDSEIRDIASVVAGATKYTDIPEYVVVCFERWFYHVSNSHGEKRVIPMKKEVKDKYLQIGREIEKAWLAIREDK